MCRRSGPCTKSKHMGRDTPASAAGRDGPPAALPDGAMVRPDPKLRWERARRLLCCLFQRRGRAECPLQGQEPVRQEAQRGVVVEAGPRTSFEVIQSQFFLELLVALLHLPARPARPLPASACWRAVWTARRIEPSVRHSTSSQRASALVWSQGRRSGFSRVPSWSIGGLTSNL